jgi:hypothetical protein
VARSGLHSVGVEVLAGGLFDDDVRNQAPILPNTFFLNFTHICNIFLKIFVKFLTNL